MSAGRPVEGLDPEKLRASCERLRTALALYDTGVAMKRAQLRREDGAASDEQIAQRLKAWLHARPAAPNGDAEGVARPPDPP